ncbi:MAG: DUF2971 domain-containing protein [Polynucleobacter sp.]|nr:DUF2971 domain-containing protein [Polynucleobacter sp.]
MSLDPIVRFTVVNFTMAFPTHLYRFRPLDDALLERELAALQTAFLWSPHFREMNDPMEAFYVLGGAADPLVDILLKPTGKSTRDVYEMVRSTVDNFCLVSLSTSHMALPMWAYYASNFAGMCLEFRTAEMFNGDLQNERLMQVTYADTAPPPLQFHHLGGDRMQKGLEACFSRKRVEWRHEQEWRILTGAGGAKHYVDDALSRIFLGPRIDDDHANRICAIFKDRPTEILRGKVHGYNLRFETVKPATAFANCTRVGAGKLNIEDLLYSREEISSFLEVPISDLEGRLREIVSHPNVEEILSCDISGERGGNAIYIWATYRLRSGRDAWKRIYLDRRLGALPYTD